MQSENQSRYQSVPAKKASGSTYTPPALAGFVAQRVASLIAKLREPGAELRILDPAVGNGELLIQIINALRVRGFERVRVAGYDLDGIALENARNRLAAANVREVSLTHADFLSTANAAQNLSLQAAPPFQPTFDVIIANPPYVRTQILGGELAQTLAQKHGLTGRIDLYQAFIVTLADWLVPSGVAGVITSNRFLTVKSGEVVRGHLWSTFWVRHVWDLGDTKCFEAAVLPAITLLEKPDGELSTQGEALMTSVYEARERQATSTADSIFDALSLDGVVAVGDRRFEVRQGRVETERDGKEVWRLGNPVVEAWLQAVASRTWKTFGQIGNIRVGIKTTADAVFIRDDWEPGAPGAPELLRPLTTHHIGRRYRAHPVQTRSVLYTHEVSGGKRRAVDLARYPMSQAYLQAHRVRLAGRKYVAKANRNWFEIWVPQDPSQWPLPKLVFRDITDKPQFWIDLSGSVINGDCYWMTAGEQAEDLLWLALAIGNSRFICDFYDNRFNNKLYAGRRRFITQYVKHFPLPAPDLPGSRELVRLAREAYDAADSDSIREIQNRIDRVVFRSFGLSVEEPVG